MRVRRNENRVGRQIVESINKKTLNEKRDVAGDAIFVASSTRDGYGLENVRDDNYETYWQSNGQLPHVIDIIFRRPTQVNRLHVCINPNDESYAPCQMVVQAGTDFNDLRCFDIKNTDLVASWQIFDISHVEDAFVKVMMLRLVIVSNHFNGIDTRIRQILVCGPDPASVPENFSDEIKDISSLPNTTFLTLR